MWAAPHSVWTQVMKMAKNAEDSARIQGYMDRMKNAPKSLNLNRKLPGAGRCCCRRWRALPCMSAIPVNTLDEIKKAVEVFNKTGEACKKNGVQFAYHNHTTEFDEVEGHRPFDYILNNTEQRTCKDGT